jgi:hypothetical protein
MISERSLKQWRQDALVDKGVVPDDNMVMTLLGENKKLRERVLATTQELLDQHLIRRSNYARF